jgi:diguanylate cyclase (GGDEF)-like protein/PAS domain S-box-containing protein
MKDSADAADPPGPALGAGLYAPPAVDLAAIVRLARRLLGVAAAVAVVDPVGASQRRSWIDRAAEAPPAAALEAAALALPAEPTTWIADLSELPAGQTGPRALLPPSVRFLAANAIGNGLLAVFDAAPRPRTEVDARSLADLAEAARQLLAQHATALKAVAAEREFRILAETSTDTIVRGNLDGIRLYVSPAVRDLLGYEPEELIGRRAVEIVHPDDVPGFAAMMQRVREGRREVAVAELRQRHRDGSWVWMEAAVRLTYAPGTDIADGYVASVRDIRRRKELEQRLERLASSDDLTGLPNRARFRDQLLAALAAAAATGSEHALLYLDIDRFKHVNDGFGHPAGDEVLREAALRMRSVLGDGDFIARLGGDEFGAVLVGGRARAEAAAADLLAVMATPFRYGTVDLNLGVSIGIACVPEHGLDAERVLARADRALYGAKLGGRNAFRVSE